MRKQGHQFPLDIGLGNVLTADLHSIRVLLQGLWGAVADHAAMIVEPTHARREEYLIKWPQETVTTQPGTAQYAVIRHPPSWGSALLPI